MPLVYVNTFGELYFRGNRYEVLRGAGQLVSVRPLIGDCITVSYGGEKSNHNADAEYEGWRIPWPSQLGYLFRGDRIVVTDHPAVIEQYRGRLFTVVDWDGNLVKVQDGETALHFHGYTVNVVIAGKANPKEGWGWPALSKKAHYFSGSHSLCLKWLFSGELESRLAYLEPEAKCRACVNRLTAGEPDRKR